MSSPGTRMITFQPPSSNCRALTWRWVFRNSSAPCSSSSSRKNENLKTALKGFVDQVIRVVRMMHDESVLLSGRKLTTLPCFFIGAAANPFIPPFNWRPQRIAKKIAAGAQFIQTQYCFDIPRFKEYMNRVRDQGLDKQAFILAGVGPLKSAGAAEFMRNKVPGVHISDEIIDRMRKMPKEKQSVEGKKICVEMIEQIKDRGCCWNSYYGLPPRGIGRGNCGGGRTAAKTSYKHLHGSTCPKDQYVMG